MQAFDWFLLLLTGVICFFLAFPFVTVVISRFKKEPKSRFARQKSFDFGCIITAYRNAEIAKPLVASLLRQTHQHHLVYLVADDCNVEGFDFQHENFVLLRPESPLNLKVKSIIYAMEHFRRNHDYVVIFDADNLAHPEFLQRMNDYANEGHLAVQGQRTAKNLDTVFAAMDALGEFYKNYIERFVTYLLGSSSVISGSGMAVETGLYRAYLASPEIEQGKHLWKKMLQEDKILQNFLLRRNCKIAFAWDAICYDEKVSSARAVETQRSRWLFSYFQNLPNSLGILRRGITNFTWNQFYFGLVTISPPLFILVFLADFLAVMLLFFSWKMTLIVVCCLMIFAGNVLWTLHLSKVPKQVWKAVWSLPIFVLKQVTALLKIGNPNKNFQHSEHTKQMSIEEVLSQKF